VYHYPYYAHPLHTQILTENKHDKVGREPVLTALDICTSATQNHTGSHTHSASSNSLPPNPVKTRVHLEHLPLNPKHTVTPSLARTLLHRNQDSGAFESQTQKTLGERVDTMAWLGKGNGRSATRLTVHVETADPESGQTEESSLCYGEKRKEVV
jgi:hypothetical protein